MIALLVSVFFASLLGSVHCAGMCGPLAACAGVKANGKFWSRLHAVSAYQAGRLMTYLVIGAVAGVLGGGLNLTGDLIGWQQAAVWCAGGLLIAIGVTELTRRWGGWAPRFYVPQRVLQTLAAANRAATRWPTTWRGITIGLLTGLMPCGWLYAFALSAAATADPWLGMAVMGVFWLGSVPMLTAITWGSSTILSRVLQRFPYATAVLLIVAGIMTLTYRQPALASDDWQSSFAEFRKQLETAPDQADAAARLERLGDGLQTLDHEQLPCCAADAKAKTPAGNSADQPRAAGDSTATDRPAGK